MRTSKFFIVSLFISSVAYAGGEKFYLKIGTESGTMCVVPSLYDRFAVIPCAQAAPTWNYIGQSLQYNDQNCLTIEPLQGGYRISGKVCDGGISQVFTQKGNKFIDMAYGLCLTTENNFVSVRGSDTCGFKSPWQDFDTPSNLFLVSESQVFRFDFDNSPVFQAVNKPFIDPVSIPIHPFYANINQWFNQTQYLDAYDVAHGHIFSGDPAVSILQAEDSVPSSLSYPDIIGAANLPPGGHADSVASIMYGCDSSDHYFLFYLGCLKNITKMAKPVQDINDALRDNSHDWMAMDTWIGTVFPNGIIPSIYSASVANAFFVLSQSDSISSQDLSVRIGDYLLDRYNILGVVAQPGSYTDTNNTVSGNLYNALVVGNLQAGPNYETQSTLDNTDGILRFKPDIVTLGQNRASSSSWATPTVSVLAAGLFSVAQSDVRFSLAKRAEAVAAIILAGAAKDSEVPIQLQKWNVATQSLEPWTWSQSLPYQPLDKYFGVGILNYLKTYQVFFAGPYKGAPRANGWDTQVIHPGESKTYLLDENKTTNFSGVLYWNRKITATLARKLDSYLPHLQMEIQNVNGVRVALSDVQGNNRQHIFMKNLPAGPLKLIVRNMSIIDVQYGVAWRSDN